MNGIMDELMSSTVIVKGERCTMKKFYFDRDDNYDDSDYATDWIGFGETIQLNKPRDLSTLTSRQELTPSIFRYFLDGSRHIYKIDDVSFDGNIYPVMAGQVVISCCRRDGREMHNEFFERRLVIVLPKRAIKKDCLRNFGLGKLLDELNSSRRLKQFSLTIDEVLLYNLDAGLSHEMKAVIAVQSYMVEREKLAVLQLAEQRKLRKGAYLVKDGSIEYKVDRNAERNLDEGRLRAAYDYVIGVSKSFNPLNCYVKPQRGRQKLSVSSSVVASLRPFERTPAYRYRANISGKGVYFCVWYLRLHPNCFTRNVFDGVVKVEKLLTCSEEIERGVDSERIDLISANLLRERNPVCYGADPRWANHIYPMYVTESFAKNNFISSSLFTSLF